MRIRLCYTPVCCTAAARDRVSDAEIAEEQWGIALFDAHREDLQFGYRYFAWASTNHW
ncbi:hypothetical protein [Mycolicibacterium gadium]|jgi:hypothetical protein|uniref:hypothetical protein n=1 Tax=Mycolicibacterium gadium TaxID=1794 RepID=UPI002FDDB2B7